MRNDVALNFIYNFLPAQQDGKTQSFYKVLNFFSETGNVDNNVLKSLHENYSSNGPKEWICFDSLDDLGSYALEVCKKLDCPEVFILSAQDYNLAIENTMDVRGFRDIFRRYGTSLDNPDKVKKKNVFTKLFN